jgi:hypothetical protein
MSTIPVNVFVVWLCRVQLGGRDWNSGGASHCWIGRITIALLLLLLLLLFTRALPHIAIVSFCSFTSIL